ncbi:type VI secretion system baseplate subunit TssF [Nannocystis bainbridge]|uniref:Type VI secretion system baseplate subunit TssF n=1 Tax=Nannocystis bainbridge TaxID=2995303 RepID=A0ABT5E5H6_9BACT|nr:type VI secretion system baseplate subunit TssF [Nannocystis bainbridge]MDC0721103.1 type VI secretion system baseplate subunit TssF [Nannocystis bainbridge]
MSFSHYYKSELAFITEMARAFAEANPATAGLLKERSSDPDVERLIEAFAFQAAGIRARMDAVAPSIVHGLAELLLPHYLRPLPAATIVEFQPNMRALRNRHKVAKGRVLQSRLVEGTACKFRTCWDVDLAPVEVVDATLDDSVAARPAIKITLRLSETGKGVLAECERLRFFLHHREPSLPATLMMWLSRHFTGASAKTGEGEGGTVQLGAKAIELVGLSRDTAVFPWPDTAPTGYRAILEYFTLPEKYHFFDLLGLDKVKLTTNELTLRLEFERPPPLPTQVGKDTFRLHCTPAVNLFEVAAEPVQYSPLEREHLLRADGVDPRHMEVYEVRGVTGVGRATNTRRQFLPFYRFTHAGAARSTPHYSLRRVEAIDDGVDTYITLDEPAGSAPTQEESVSIELVCTNRGLPRELQPGQITETTPGAMFRGYENITQVTAPIRVPLGSEALWRMLSHLAIGQRGLVEVEALRALLGLYNLQGLGNVQIGRGNERQIESVRRLQRETVTRLVYGIPIRAVRTRIELDESGFPSAGNAFVFGGVLNALFGSLVSLNAASEVVITLVPSKAEFAWPVQIGL